MVCDIIEKHVRNHPKVFLFVPWRAIRFGLRDTAIYKTIKARHMVHAKKAGASRSYSGQYTLPE
jgi:hypothetical protein